MTGNTGSMTIQDLLKAQNTSLAAFGMDNILQVLENDLKVHNTIVNELLGDFAVSTNDRQRMTGASTNGRMVKVDEFGRGPTQRPNFGSQVAFPLNKFQFAIGWTRDWFKRKTTQDFANLVDNAEKAHILQIRAELKNALYLSSNYTIRDYLTDNISFNIKRLQNADGSAIPDGPNGEIFNPATHNHYSAIASLTGAAVVTLINNVREHGLGGKIQVAFSATDELTVRALTGFQAYLDPRVQRGTGIVPDQKSLDLTRMDNLAIGILGAAEIWLKPWAIANYAFAWDAAAPLKPLALRVETGKSGLGLTVAAPLDEYPLYAEWMEDYFGFGVANRTNGAVLYFGGGSYVDPVIT